jgi:Na+/phosphate symporter
VVKDILGSYGVFKMTNYDKLIDAISDEIYHYLLSVSQPSWDEEVAKKTSHRILEIVEEFQKIRSDILD